MIQNEVNTVFIALILHVDSIPRVGKEINSQSHWRSPPYPLGLKPGGLRRAKSGHFTNSLKLKIRDVRYVFVYYPRLVK